MASLRFMSPIFKIWIPLPASQGWCEIKWSSKPKALRSPLLLSFRDRCPTVRTEPQVMHVPWGQRADFSSSGSCSVIASNFNFQRDCRAQNPQPEHCVLFLWGRTYFSETWGGQHTGTFLSFLFSTCFFNATALIQHFQDELLFRESKIEKSLCF